MQDDGIRSKSMKYNFRQMFTKRALFVLGLGLLASCRMMAPPGAPRAQRGFSFLHADGARTVNEAGEPVVLKGCNLGN